MRLKRLDLIKYGKFTDEPLSFPTAGNDFHVIVGPNEAGKSTVRMAVSELLFGMKLQTPFDFLHNTPELRLGGRLETSGDETVFHRARGRNSLRTPEDEKLPDDYLAALLDGASREFFEQMFGLDHERLIEGGKSILNASDKLGQVLFESAAGVGSLGAVRESLESRAGELWAPRRTNSEYAQAEASFNEAASELKVAQVRTRDWVDKKEAFEAVNHEIEHAHSEQVRLETLRSKLERVRRLAPFIKQLSMKEAELAGLGEVVELPPSAYTDLLKAQGDIAAARTVLEERTAYLKVKQAERDALNGDGAVLALTPDIEALDQLRGACVNHPRDLPLRQADVERHLSNAFNAAAQLGWPVVEESLRAALPKALTLKTVTNLLREHGALHQALLSATEVVGESRRNLTELQARLSQLATTEVPEALRVALSAAQGFKNYGTKERDLECAVAGAEHRLTQALGALGKWRMAVHELRALDLPSLGHLSDLQKQESERESAVASEREALAKAEVDIGRLTLQEKHFVENNKVVTAAEVLAARTRRDYAWDDVKKGAVSLEAGAPVVDDAIRLADELVDSQLGTTQAAATLQALRQQLEMAHADLKSMRATLSDCERELTAFRGDWEGLTVRAGVPGMSLAEMAAWLAKREEVFAAVDALELHKSELEGVRKARAVAQSALLAALRAVSLGDEADELPALIATAESFVVSAERGAAQKDSLADQLRQAERSQATAQQKVSAAQSAYDGWKAQWRDALEAAQLTEAATTLSAAEGAIELVNTIAANFASAEDPRNRILAMHADMSALEAEARRLAEALEPELVTLGNWFDIARRLMARLSAAKETSKAIERTNDAILQAGAKVADAEAAVAGAEARVRHVLQLANVESIELALPLAKHSDQRRALLHDVDRLNEALIGDGDGLTREVIAAEIAAYDPAQVPVLLEKVKQDLAAVSDGLSNHLQEQVTAKQEFETINGRANAALAEAKRQEALSTMGEAAEQYLEAATAGRLLKWATDRYRDQKQGPMLKRAGEVFSGLTLGEFSKLAVDTEATPPKLYAKRSNGKPVNVDGLSEGTRDQLFLALRIAALELQLKHKGALPFIADDLFINFDDERAKAGLEALRDLSSKTQVLFLTHHGHLVPLVRQVFGERVNIVELRREASIA